MKWKDLYIHVRESVAILLFIPFRPSEGRHHDNSHSYYRRMHRRRDSNHHPLILRHSEDSSTLINQHKKGTTTLPLSPDDEGETLCLQSPIKR